MAIRLWDQKRAPRRKVLVIYNPTSGQRNRGLYKQTLKLLAHEGCVAVVQPTSAAGEATKIARGISPGAFDAVIAAGGDGTVNEVLNGLAADSPPLALMPLGTANVLAHEIGLLIDAKHIARTIVYGETRPMFLPVATHGEGPGRRFALMVGAGFDARVVASVSPRLKRALGKGAYMLRSLTELIKGVSDTFTVTVDGVPYQASSVIVANARRYGGRFIAAPEASVYRPDLEICLLATPGRFGVLTSALGLLTGQLAKAKGVRIVRGHDIRLSTPAQQTLQMDGDTAGMLPVHIQASNTPVRLVQPISLTRKSRLRWWRQR